MQHELKTLLDDARQGDLTPAAFSQRLEAIQGLFLGDDLNSAGNIKARQEALAAYEQLTSGIDRHHQLELIAQALGVDQTAGG